MREVGAEFAGEIGARNNAYVDFVAELGEDTGRRPPDAVSARFVDARAHSDIGFDAVRKVDELFAFELDWDDALLAYHERSSDRLAEMQRALPADDRSAELDVDRRMATHAMTTKPPDADRVSRWKREMPEADAGLVKGLLEKALKNEFPMVVISPD